MRSLLGLAALLLPAAAFGGVLNPTFIGTTPSPGSPIFLGSGGEPTLDDTATLSGGLNPAGTITFTLQYLSTTVDTETVSVNGNGSYSTPTGYTLPSTGGVVGTYTWTATYSSDQANASSSEGGENQGVIRATPNVLTTATPSSVTGGGGSTILEDSATLSGGYFPMGTLTFELFDPSSTQVDTETVSVSGNGSYDTPTGFTLPSDPLAGTWDWEAIYSGDANNLSVVDPLGNEPVTVAPPAPEPSSIAIFAVALVGLGYSLRQRARTTRA